VFLADVVLNNNLPSLGSAGVAMVEIQRGCE
jgi:hypothetical protein